MNGLNESITKKPDVPEAIQARWQRIADLMATIAGVPAGLIMKVDSAQIEVFISSATDGNPYHKGERTNLNTGQYCQTVMKQRAQLLVTDALKHPEWDHNPDIKLGMTFYLGYPLAWPDGELFGTICILDEKDNIRATQLKGLISEFQQVVESDLRLMIETCERQDLLGELERHRNQLKEMVVEQTSELERKNEELEELLKFEDLVSGISANFVNLPPEMVRVEIGLALKRICGFLGTDHCIFLEILKGPGEIESVKIYQEDEERKEPMSGLASRHPWTYHKLVEKREPVVFSSLEALPFEASVDRAYWEQEGVQSALVLPVTLGDRVTHFIGTWSCRCSQELPLALIRCLSFLGMVLSKGLLHMRAQEALIKSERELAEAQRIAHLGSWDWDIRGGVHHWSDELYRIFGLLPQEIEATYEAFLASVHPDDRQAVDQANKESLSDPDNIHSIEHRVVRPDGTERVVHARREVFFDQNRRPVRMIGTVHDITARKHLETEAGADQIRLSMALEAAGMVTWEWDISTRSIRYSDNLQAIVRGTAVEPYCSLEALMPEIHPDDREGLAKALDQASKEGTPFECEYRVHMLDGTYRWILGKGKRVVVEGGKPVRVLGLSTDITERKHAEETLKKAFDEIKELKEQLEAENIYLREEVELKGCSKDIIGISNPIKYVMHRISQVAPTSMTVLLIGETGTGKGLFARALHQGSSRRDKPFVNVNCAGLPPNLIESELFGREKGAFTGSTARQIGRFEIANGGTILLDEIGELPLELQAKLLKVIENGEFERLGSPHTVKVDVRIIASTNRDIEEEVKKGQFRKDLFYRLNVFPITIPSLKQRRKDIPLLVKSYAETFCKKHGKHIETIPKNTMKALEDYAWPGNVRELINVIERAVIVSDGTKLRLAEKIDALPIDSTQGNEGMNTLQTKDLVEVERKHILKILQETGWKIEGLKGAAQLLGMNPSTLKSRMRKLGIKRPTPD